MKKHNYICGIVVVIAGALLAQTAMAGVVRIDETAFQPGAGLITFSEYSTGTVNPSYTPANYGGVTGEPNVNFGGYFKGQSLSASAATDCPGGAATGCVVGTPSGPLSLDPSSPQTEIVNDGANPTSPVLSGSPTFNGPVAILFSHGVAGVGLDGGFFDALNATKIEAFGVNGNSLGYVTNNAGGIDFLGLVTDNKAADIFGLLFSLSGDEPAGFGIDNLRFGAGDQIVVPPSDVPEPAELGLFGLGLLLIGLLFGVRRRVS